MTNELVYRLEGRLNEILPIGRTPDGVRMDSHFSGKITAGDYAGVSVTGVDYVRVRSDGVVVVDARDLLTIDGHLVAVTVT